MATPDIGDSVLVIGDLPKHPEIISKKGEIIEVNGSWYVYVSIYDINMIRHSAV